MITRDHRSAVTSGDEDRWRSWARSLRKAVTCGNAFFWVRPDDPAPTSPDIPARNSALDFSERSDQL